MTLDFDVKNTLILIIAVINITYGAIIYLKDKKSATSIWFFLLAISVGLWGVSMFMFRSSQEIYFAEIFARILYFSAAIIPITFIYFAAVFPSNLSSLTFQQKYLLPVPFFIIALLSLSSGVLVTGVHFYPSEETHIFFNVFYHTLYVLYINIFFIYGYFILIKKYLENRAQNTILSRQIIYIIAGTFISTLIGVFTNLFGPYVGIFKFNWVGQIGNVIMISAISYAIVKHRLFNIKLILVELAILLLNLFLFLNVFTSHERADLILNASVSAAILAFSIFLIRGIYKDIRDRERIGELVKEMELANEKLRMLEGQKTEFVSIASHQLRTPLTVIKGYASMILEGTFGHINDSARDAMEKLYKSSERIVALVEDLLTVSRIEQGRMMLVFEKVNFKDFVQSGLAELADEVAEAKIDLSFTAEEDKEFFVDIDEKKFKQVVKHILENAIKYTPAPGSVRVAVSDDELTKKVRLTVSDTGIGMTREQITSIFERFNLKANMEEAKVTEGEHAGHGKQWERGEQGNLGELGEKWEQSQNDEAEAKMMEKRSPGIGLYIAQEIIEAHKGTLRIESAGTDRGTTVVVELPRGEKR